MELATACQLVLLIVILLTTCYIEIKILGRSITLPTASGNMGERLFYLKKQNLFVCGDYFAMFILPIFSANFIGLLPSSYNILSRSECPASLRQMSRTESSGKISVHITREIGFKIGRENARIMCLPNNDNRNLGPGF